MEKIEQIIEALIFASETPLPSKKIKEILDEGSEREIKKSSPKLTAVTPRANRRVDRNSSGRFACRLETGCKRQETFSNQRT